MTKEHAQPKKAFGVRRAEGSPGGSSSNHYLAFGICIFLAVAVFAVFGQTLGYGFFDYDDGQYVYANPHVTGGLNWTDICWAFTHFHCNNWHPVTWISHMLDCQLYGLNAGAHHLTNLLFHAANAILLFLLLRYLTREDWPSAFVAVVFAIHPLRVESVAWISERKDVLSGFFFMLTLLVYARYVKCVQRGTLNTEPRGASPQKPERVSSNAAFGFTVGQGCRFYWLTLLLFVVGLMSKPMLVTLPFVLLLLDYWPLQRFDRATSETRFAVIRRVIMEKIPFLCLSAASCVVTLRAQQATIAPAQWLPWSLRVDNALASYVVYLRQMFYPADLAILYPHAVIAPPRWQTALALLLLVGISASVLVLRRKRRYLVTGWLWYLGMLVPVIGLVQVGFQAHADRYTYLPQIGVYLAVAWAVRDWTVSWRYRRQILSVAAIGIVAALATCAWKQTTYWRTSVTLWRHAVACTSYNPIARANLDISLGHVLDLKGDYAEAVPLYVKALKLAPIFADSAYMAEAHYDLGTLYLKLKQPNQALEHLRRAIEFDPDLAEAHYNLGYLFAAQGKAGEAIEQYRKAIAAKPHYTDAHFRLALLLTRHGQLDNAVAQYRKVLKLKPDSADAENNLANLLALQGKVDEAMVHYRRAVKLKPDYVDAHRNLANILLVRGQLNEAAEQYRKVIELAPDDAKAHYRLGLICGKRGELKRAVKQFQQAIAIKPGYVNAHGQLANAYFLEGKLNEAIREYRKTLALSPDSAQAHFRYGRALEKEKRFGAAIVQYEKTLQLDPKHQPARLALAWLLATCPESALRNGQKAVALGHQAARLSANTSPQILDTLAAAYAEAGQFSEAVETARRALNLSVKQSNESLTDAIRNHLKLFENHTPYHEKP